MATYEWKGNGRKPLSRLALAKSFVAKMVWNLPTTEALRDPFNLIFDLLRSYRKPLL